MTATYEGAVYRILCAARKENPTSEVIDLYGKKFNTRGFAQVCGRSRFFTKEKVDELATFHSSSPDINERHQTILGVGRPDYWTCLSVNSMEELFILVWEMIRFCNTPPTYTTLGVPWTSNELEEAWEQLSGRVFEMPDEKPILQLPMIII